MKIIVLLIIIASIYSCSSKFENQSLEPIKVEYIDNIPYLMRTIKIDSVFEIIRAGKIRNLNEGDTITLFYNNDNIIHQKIKSIWCCKNTYTFDSLNYITNETFTSDYTVELNYKWKRNGNKIYNVNNNKIDSSYYYIIENEKPIVRINSHPNDDGIITDTTRFEYDSKFKLIKTVQNREFPSYSSEYRVQKIIKTYEWKAGKLEKVITTINKSHKLENEFLQIDTLNFDSIGFPKSKSTVLFDNDTIIKIKTSFKYKINNK